MTAAPIGLASRERAHTILHEVLDRGRPLDETLQRDRRLAKLSERDRAFARNLVATTLRRLGQIDAILNACLDRPLPRSAAAARNALRLGACQILFLDTQTHAAVDTSVALAARRGPDRFKAVVNAILRRLARECDGLLDSGDYPATLNTPSWLLEAWAAAFGDAAARRIAEAHLAPPHLDVTVRRDPGEWAARLGGAVLAGDTVRLSGGGDVTALPGFAEGAWWVQDAAAALPARILISALRPGAKVLDLCAAPGGKTAQLAAAGLDVTAVDASEARLGSLADNLKRLRLQAGVVTADVGRWQPESPCDGVLLDAPCTATGTIRRHPDIPHLKKPADVLRQVDLQRKLLRSAAGMTAPGGVLVYSVCSLQPEEGPRQIEDFLRSSDDYARLPIAAEEVPGFDGCLTAAGDILTTPFHFAEKGGVDGFFVARLRRRAGG